MTLRTNKIIVIVGNRGTGKTDYTKNLSRDFPQPKTIIADYFDNPAWRSMKTWDHPQDEAVEIPMMSVDELPYHKSGRYRLVCSDTRHMQSMIAEHAKNSLVIMEDVQRYFNNNLLESQRRYLMDSKQTNCDIVLVYHTLAQISLQVLRLADYLVMFKVGDRSFDKKKYDYPGFEEKFNFVQKSANRYENLVIDLQA
jgi:hypothetical protein